MPLSASDRVRPTGMHEIVLHVDDLERATRFYADVIGLTVVQRWGPGRPAVWFDCGDTVALGLWTTKAEQGAIANGRGGAHVHLALRIPPGSLEAVQQDLAERGYDTLRIDFDDGNRSLYLDDPDGHCLELMDAVVDWAGQPVVPR